MAVIEPEPEPEPEPESKPSVVSEINRNPPQEASTDSSADAAAAATYKDFSDGFETASDGEHGDEDGEDSEDPRVQQRSPGNHQKQEEPAPPKDQSYKDALNDEELNQNILSQVNDAKVEGNRLFSDGQYEEALLGYDRALNFAPEGSSFAEIRSICHSNRAVCYFKMGKYEETIKECTKALQLNPTYMKALVRRKEAHEKLDNFDEAIADSKKILELDPANGQVRKSIRRLEPLAEAKREKLKEEMIGKLKDMGNSVLGRFGMSVDNFKAVKDPNTGSYSISFQR